MNFNRIFTLLLFTITFVSCKNEPNLKIPEIGLYTSKSDVFPYINYMQIDKEGTKYTIEFYETKNGDKKCSFIATGKESYHGIEINDASTTKGATILITKQVDKISAGPKGPEVATDVFTYCDSKRTPSGYYTKVNSLNAAANSKRDADFMEPTVHANKAEEVERYILNNILDKPSELEFVDASSRKFQLYTIDLNGDGKDETFVRLMGSYFCGSGGCTFLILNSENSLITKFTVTRPPFFISKQKVNGWRTILMKSEGEFKQLIFKDDTYPSNPSIVQPTDLSPSGHDEVLFDDEMYPAKTYEF